jgi:Amt family ammonium transporter
VDCTGAFFIGLLSGCLCFFTAHAKHRFGYDDALDAFGIHGPGGILGGILTGVFATETITGAGSGVKGCLYGNWRQLGLQVYGCLVAVVWSSLVSWLLLKAIDSLVGLRVALAVSSLPSSPALAPASVQ